jgi:hypothetical protein
LKGADALPSCGRVKSKSSSLIGGARTACKIVRSAAGP